MTYNCAWSHIEWCTWQPWTIANSVLNCEIRLRTGFGGHKDTWADLHEDLLIAHSPTVGCAFCHNVKASLCHHLKLIFMSEYMKMHPRSTARVQLSLCNVKKNQTAKSCWYCTSEHNNFCIPLRRAEPYTSWGINVVVRGSTSTGLSGWV